MKRMTCTFPDDTAADIRRMAKEDVTSIIATVQTLVKYGLLLRNLLKDPAVKVLIRDEQGEREIILP